MQARPSLQGFGSPVLGALQASPSSPFSVVVVPPHCAFLQPGGQISGLVVPSGCFLSSTTILSDPASPVVLSGAILSGVTFLSVGPASLEVSAVTCSWLPPSLLTFATHLLWAISQTLSVALFLQSSLDLQVVTLPLHPM